MKRHHIPIILAALALAASSCSSSSEAAVVESATATPIPAVPTETPTETPTEAPTPEPTEPPPEVGEGVQMNMPPLSSNEPYSWPENGMEKISNDVELIQVWIVVEYLNAEGHYDSLAWRQLEDGYLHPGFVEMIKGAPVAPIFDESTFVDVAIIPDDDEFPTIRTCTHNVADSDTAKATMIMDFEFNAPGHVVPKMTGFRPVEILSEDELVPCDV